MNEKDLVTLKYLDVADSYIFVVATHKPFGSHTMFFQYVNNNRNILKLYTDIFNV
jgi:hypothetical protein